MSFQDDIHEAELAESYEAVLASTAALLADKGDEQAVALLIDVKEIAFIDSDEVIREYDNGWGGIQAVYSQVAALDVEGHLVSRFTREVSQRILEVMQYVAERHGLTDLVKVVARAAIPRTDANWRETYAARLEADHPTNQARNERGLINKPVEDGLTFGSAEELRVYRTLKQLQSEMNEIDTFAILPSPGARIRAGHTWTPDFVVVGRHKALIIEIDGPHHKATRRVADDRNRDLQWDRCNIPVVRIPVEDLADDTELRSRLIESLKRHLPKLP